MTARCSWAWRSVSSRNGRRQTSPVGSPCCRLACTTWPYRLETMATPRQGRAAVKDMFNTERCGNAVIVCQRYIVIQSLSCQNSCAWRFCLTLRKHWAKVRNVPVLFFTPLILFYVILKLQWDYLKINSQKSDMKTDNLPYFSQTTWFIWGSGLFLQQRCERHHRIHPGSAQRVPIVRLFDGRNQTDCIWVRFQH